MCSRYSLTSPPEAVRAYFGYRDTPNFPARYNIAPTQVVAVVRHDREGQRQFRLMRWGLLPSFVKDLKQFPTLINARSEEVLDKPSFRQAMRYRRCLVPANAFYEWTGPKSKRRPFLLRPRAAHLIAFAGIYEHWRDQTGAEVDTVAILTCPANCTVAPLHDRMPVVLPVEHFEAWLDVNGIDAATALAPLQPARSVRGDRDCIPRSTTPNATSPASMNRRCFRGPGRCSQLKSSSVFASARAATSVWPISVPTTPAGSISTRTTPRSCSRPA